MSPNISRSCRLFSSPPNQTINEAVKRHKIERKGGMAIPGMPSFSIGPFLRVT